MNGHVKGIASIIAAISMALLVAYFKVYDQGALSFPATSDMSDEVLPLQNTGNELFSRDVLIDPSRDYATVDLAELDSRLSTYFAAVNFPERMPGTTPPLDIDQFLDRQRAWEFIEIRYWLGVAIDLRMDLGQFSKYGVEALGEGKYGIDLQNFPEWIQYHHSLSRFLNDEFFTNSVTRTLLSMGLSQGNLNSIESYLDSHNPALDANTALLAIVDAEYARAKSLQPEPDKEAYTALYYELSYLAFYATSRIRVEWCLNLFEQLDRIGQVILARFLRNEAASTTMMPNQVVNLEELYIEELASMRWRNEIQKAIGSLQTPRARNN